MPHPIKRYTKCGFLCGILIPADPAQYKAFTNALLLTSRVIHVGSALGLLF